jgi:DNA polymerase V
MYLAKIAMDIVAKHVPADKDGVRIAELTEQSYRELLWCHRPITDFWRVGPGTARRLEKLGCFTMGDVARMSERNEDALYKAFGINAELLIDHAWGWEPTEIPTIKAYRPENNSLSSGQVLMEPYPFDKARIIVREMTELMVLDLVRKGLVTKQVMLTISYDRESLTVLDPGDDLRSPVYGVKTTGKPYTGTVTPDFYGRPHPKHTHGTGNLPFYTSSTRRIMDVMMELFDRIVDPELLVRRVTIVAAGIIPEKDIPPEQPKGVVEGQFDLFSMMDTEEEKAEQEAEKALDRRERRLQEITLRLQGKNGKNAILKGTNFEEGATTRDRNLQIGGHRSGD